MDQPPFNPLTQGADTSQSAFNPLTQGADTSQSAFNPLTQGADTSQSPFNPLTQGADTDQSALSPVASGADSDQPPWVKQELSDDGEEEEDQVGEDTGDGGSWYTGMQPSVLHGNGEMQEAGSCGLGDNKPSMQPYNELFHSSEHNPGGKNCCYPLFLHDMYMDIKQEAQQP